MLVSTEEAMAFTGHKLSSSFQTYVSRINRALPQDKKVVRICGRYDLESLKEAVATYSRMDKKLTRVPYLAKQCKSNNSTEC